MAALLELSGKSCAELLLGFSEGFCTKTERNCMLPPSERLRLLLTLLEFVNSGKQSEKDEVTYGPKFFQENDLTLIEDYIPTLCHGCIRLLLHRSAQTHGKEDEMKYQLMLKIVIQCCKFSHQCMDFGLEFCLVNINEFSKAASKDHAFDKQKIIELYSSRVCDCCDVNEMPISTVLGFLHNLIELEAEKTRTNGVMEEKIFNSLLTLLRCDADDTIMAIVSEIISLFINNDANRKKLWEHLTKFNKESNSGTPYAVMSLLLSKFLGQGHFDIREDQSFSSFIQNGLLHHDSLTRKRAVYILKCVVDFSSKQRTADDDQNDSQWSKMNSFILLIETLEEKQLHVILPVLSSVQEIIELCSYSSSGKRHLHVSWLTTILSRAFNHDNRFVTKWAIETSLQLDIDKLGLLTEKNLSFISGPLLTALGESHLYDIDGNSDGTKSGSIPEQLKVFFLKCGDSTVEIESRKAFFKEVLMSLYSTKISAIPFSYMTEALSHIKIPGIIDIDLLNTIKSYLLSCISMYPTELKAAAHYLTIQIVLHGLDTRVVTWKELIGFLKISVAKGYINYGSNLWDNIRSSMTDCGRNLDVFGNEDGKSLADLANDSLRQFLSDKSEDFDVAEETGFLFLYAVDVLCSGKNVKIESTIESILHPLINILSKVGRNPYLSVSEVSHSMHFMGFIIRKLTASLKMLASKPNDHKRVIINVIMNIFQRFIQSCLQYTRTIVLSVLNGQDTPSSITSSCLALQNTLCEYVRDVETPEDPLSMILSQHFSDVIDICARELSNVVERTVDDRTELVLQILNVVADFVSSTKDKALTADVDNKLINTITKLNLNAKLQSRSSNPGASQEPTSINKGYSFCLWSLVCFALKKGGVRQNILKNEIVETSENKEKSEVYLGSCDKRTLTDCIIDALDISVGKDIMPLLNCLEMLIPYVLSLDEDLAINIVHSSWRVFTEQKRRDTTFWIIYEPVVRIVFAECLLLRESQKIVGILREYWKKFEEIGEAKSNAFNVLLDHCCGIWKRSLMHRESSVCDASVASDASNTKAFTASDTKKSISNFTDLLADACIFGKLQKKITRITQQTIDYFKLKHVEESIISNNSNRDYQVRTAPVKLLLCFNPESPEDCKFVCKFIAILIEKDCFISTQHRRYYGNSVVHRQKLRLWQAILALLQFIDEDNAGNIMAAAMEGISNDNQPSIRYLIEWFVILLVYKYQFLRSLVWEKLDEATEKRVTCITSIVSILGHLAVIIPVEDFSRMVSEAFTKMLPWVQVHHMQVRIHAQVVIWKLWEEAKRMHLDDVLKQFSIIESLFSLKESNASVVKARNEIRNNFYFKYFNPLRHYSLETIYASLPELAGVATDELLHRQQLSELADCNEWMGDLKVYNSSPTLSDEIRESKDLSREEDFTKEGTFAIPADVQKKITAWKPLPPSDDPFLQKADMFKSESRQSKLILCASLIDRTPNLGGLCRTCEIFGVSTLTVGALRYLDDANFKSLSVSSEKWLDIQQVLPRHLPNYLKDMKVKGYRLVGIEQTANSKLLQDYEFQENTLLVLGNEREGIPVDLIQLLDDCVEIPQQGIIRSLNVHVSGAIIIWEYFKQLLAKQN